MMLIEAVCDKDCSGIQRGKTVFKYVEENIPDHNKHFEDDTYISLPEAANQPTSGSQC